MTAPLELRGELARLVPDAPTTLELRALVLDPSSRLYGDARGALARDDVTGLVALWGEPDAGAVAEALARDLRELTVLAPARAATPTVDALAPAGFGFAWRRAIVFAEVSGPPGLAGLAAPTSLDEITDADLEALAWDPDLEPRQLAVELARAKSRGPVAVSRVGARAVAFAHAPYKTETLFDVSVDTREAYRQRGHGARAAAALLALERARGRRAVWVALETNAASVRIAAKLGLVERGETWLANLEPQG